jgi:hypothetical protein
MTEHYEPVDEQYILLCVQALKLRASVMSFMISTRIQKALSG